MFDIITFGSATQDIIIKPKKLTLLKYEPHVSSGRQVTFPTGTKINIEDIKFLSGGGGTNTAATFALQGLKTAYCGVIGNDIAGKQIVAELKGLKVNTSLVQITKEKATNHSIVISSPDEDKTVFAYRGAAELMGSDQVPWKKLKARWLYLAPLSGLLCDTFEEIVGFAKNQGMKVAANPGTTQLALHNFEDIVKRVDILFLNQEEASFLTKIAYEQEKEIFKKIQEMHGGITVMTKGGEGVVVSDGQYLYSAVPPANRVVVDTTGAGDSFASGFLSEYIRGGGNIESAVQFGMGNSVANLAIMGAKTGLLKKGQPFERVEVKKELII